MHEEVKITVATGPAGVIVLAAGQATRMGRLKQLLPLGNRPLVEWSIQSAREARLGPIVVVLHPAVAAAGIPRHPDPVVHPVVNPWPERGQGVSLRLGLRALLQTEPSLEVTLVVLGDQPFVSANVMTGLVEAFREAARNAVACRAAGMESAPSVPVGARPVWNGKPGHPVLLSRPLLSEALAFPVTDGIKPLLDHHRERMLFWPAPGPEVITDIDTWEDYYIITRRLQSGEHHQASGERR